MIVIRTIMNFYRMILLHILFLGLFADLVTYKFLFFFFLFSSHIWWELVFIIIMGGTFLYFIVGMMARNCVFSPLNPNRLYFGEWIKTNYGKFFIGENTFTGHLSVKGAVVVQVFLLFMIYQRILIKCCKNISLYAFNAWWKL